MPPPRHLLLLMVSMPACLVSVFIPSPVREGSTPLVDLFGDLVDNSTSARRNDCPDCIFPFRDNSTAGRWHTTCTTIDGDSEAWCATEMDRNKMKKKGYCTASCPGVLPPTMPHIHPGNTVGQCCKSPVPVVLLYNVFGQHVARPTQRLRTGLSVERTQASGSSRGRSGQTLYRHLVQLSSPGRASVRF